MQAVTPDNQWLVELVTAFNRGSLQRVSQLQATWMQKANSGTPMAELALADSQPLLWEKARLMALMQMVFEREPHERSTVPYDCLLYTSPSPRD